MKLSQLFENLAPAAEADDINRAWRSYASDTCELTLDNKGTNASNAFPVIRAAGTWYGFTARPKGGESKEANRVAPLKVRFKGLLKKIAADVEKLIASGREVRVSSFINGCGDAKYYQQCKVVEAGTVFDTLVSMSRQGEHDGLPRLYIWVAANVMSVGSVLLTVTIGVRKKADVAHPLFSSRGVAVSLSKPKAKAVLAQIVNANRDGVVQKTIDMLINDDNMVADTTHRIYGEITGRRPASCRQVEVDELVKILKPSIPDIEDAVK